jgi:hypothetical protein
MRGARHLVDFPLVDAAIPERYRCELNVELLIARSGVKRL